MTKYEVFKFIHITAVIVWIGGGMLGVFFTERARRADAVHRLGIAGDMAFASQRLFGPGSGIALLAGILMVVDNGALSFGQTWIVIGLVGFALSAAIGGGMLGPQVKKLIAELEAGDGAADKRLTLITRLQYLDLGLLMIVIWAMVSKPGLG
jgi:uncharacterized membrane protein